jgi:hypothetical protein
MNPQVCQNSSSFTSVWEEHVHVASELMHALLHQEGRGVVQHVEKN